MSIYQGHSADEKTVMRGRVGGGSVEWNYLQPGWIWGAIAQKPKLWVSPLIIKEMLMKRLLVLGKPVSTDCFQDNITIFLNSFIILELAKIWH